MYLVKSKTQHYNLPKFLLWCFLCWPQLELLFIFKIFSSMVIQSPVPCRSKQTFTLANKTTRPRCPTKFFCLIGLLNIFYQFRISLPIFLSFLSFFVTFNVRLGYFRLNKPDKSQIISFDRNPNLWLIIKQLKPNSEPV